MAANYNGAANPAPDHIVILTKILARLFTRAVTPAAENQELTEWLQQGYHSQHAGDLAAADRWYRRVLERDPGNVDAHYLLGALLGQHGEPAAALGHLRQAIAAKADFGDAHAALGNVYLSLGERAAAMASYEQAVGSIRAMPLRIPTSGWRIRATGGTPPRSRHTRVLMRSHRICLTWSRI